MSDEPIAAQRMPVDLEFLSLAEHILKEALIVRDADGHAMDPHSVESDPARFDFRARLAWTLVIVAFWQLVDEAGYTRQELNVDNRTLYDALKGLRTAAIFHDWELQPLNPVSQQNALRSIIRRCEFEGTVDGIVCNLRVQAGRVTFEGDCLISLMRHLLHMLDPSLADAETAAKA